MNGGKVGTRSCGTTQATRVQNQADMALNRDAYAVSTRTRPRPHQGLPSQLLARGTGTVSAVCSCSTSLMDVAGHTSRFG